MMRPVLSVDLFCAGRAVSSVTPSARPVVARRLVRQAILADRHRKLHGTRHPEWGDGTLAAAARHHGLHAGRTACDPDMAQALIYVLQALTNVARTD